MIKIDNINEIHNILLGIAKDFHRVCVANDIPYYMLGGTMLGAIRHKGFIPWDDDMDFGVPRPFYNKLVLKLTDELSAPYRCCSYKNNDSVFSAIIKIEDSRTVSLDPRVRIPLEKQIGLNIDIFPLDYCKADDEVLKKIHRMWIIYQTIYVGNGGSSKWKNCIKTILSTLCPISRKKMLDRMHAELSNLAEGPMLSNVFGAWKEKEIIPIEWYGTGSIFSFEDCEFYGIRDYDKYLTKLYGDYMTPPKKDKHLHLEQVYWRE